MLHFPCVIASKFGPISISLRIHTDWGWRARGSVRPRGKRASNFNIFSRVVAWTCTWARVWCLVLSFRKTAFRISYQLISILRIAERSTWRWVVRSISILFYTLPWVYSPTTSVLVNKHTLCMCPNLQSVLPSRK